VSCASIPIQHGDFGYKAVIRCNGTPNDGQRFSSLIAEFAAALYCNARFRRFRLARVRTRRSVISFVYTVQASRTLINLWTHPFQLIPSSFFSSMGAKYLCCLPLRLGVLLISLVQFLASAIVSGLLVRFPHIPTSYLSSYFFRPSFLFEKLKVVLFSKIMVRIVFFCCLLYVSRRTDHEEVFFHFSSRTKTVGIILAAVYGFVALIAFTG
jgi:hypothetical protein